MCLSTVYDASNGRKEIMSNVAGIDINDGKIFLYDILGRCSVYEGTIRKIDFNNNEIEVIK